MKAKANYSLKLQNTVVIWFSIPRQNYSVRFPDSEYLCIEGLPIGAKTSSDKGYSCAIRALSVTIGCQVNNTIKQAQHRQLEVRPHLCGLSLAVEWSIWSIAHCSSEPPVWLRQKMLSLISRYHFTLRNNISIERQPIELINQISHKNTTKVGILTYLPHKAVAEVSKDKEPIGRECAEFNWFESQLMSDSNEVRFK